MINKRMNEITEKQKEQERLDVERIKLKSDIDNIRVQLKDNKITNKRNEEWVNKAVFSIKIKEFRLCQIYFMLLFLSPRASQPEKNTLASVSIFEELTCYQLFLLSNTRLII